MVQLQYLVDFSGIWTLLGVVVPAKLQERMKVLQLCNRIRWDLWALTFGHNMAKNLYVLQIRERRTSGINLFLTGS
jgi:hypothetical protein